MKTRCKSYVIDEDNKKLILEETFDKNGKVIHQMDYNQEIPNEIEYQYDQNGRLVQDRQLQNGIEVSRESFVYDDEGDIVMRELFISGELFEKAVMEKEENGFTRRTFQDTVETERLVQSYEGKNWKNEFYNQGELTETQKYTYDEQSNSAELKIHGIPEDVRILRKEKYDSEGYIVLREEFNKEGDLLFSRTLEYEGDKVITDTIMEYKWEEKKYRYFHEYDERGNLTKLECRTFGDRMLAFHNFYYDDQDRLIEEEGFENGEFSVLTGNYRASGKFHFVHEYEKLDKRFLKRDS